MSERPFDLQTDSIFQPFPKWQGWAIVVLATPALMLGAQGRAGMAWAAVISIGFAVRTFWPLKREPWFWAIIASASLAYATAVALYPWPAAPQPGWALALVILADIALLTGAIILVAALLRRAGRAT